MTFVDGRRYEGSFRNGKFHGEGTLQGPDGKLIYTGGFSEGRYEGEGSIPFKGDGLISGTWSKNQLNGPALLTNKDGSKWSITFENGKMVEGSMRKLEN